MPVHPTLPSPTCPFCAIAAAYPPIPPSSALQRVSHPPTQTSSNEPSSRAFLILATQHVLAFLDIMPLSRGHILLTTRNHWEKVGDVGVRVGEEIGKWLPVISRVTMRVIFGEESLAEDQHWNIVQNNGERAAQVVPHVHFHIIPRPPLLSSSATRQLSSWTMFGRGQRDDLDDDEGEELARLLREELAREVKRVKRDEGVDLDVDIDHKLKL
ncbi:uncharacterized protein TRUGW13939_02899 [Talaromyces rugulosus]|uniref:HIT domain-containing protein n=1 Tax=Talaromyces rugulosus TaxID=121627 RepID=A0A7H8QQQ9_TALRU|nr:uncharacterized protein TRUGW13939_02899 [Talaromyces rugulosus]QKX55801.1 hypothetical protein TRUGW13939_02899 [Talaromyces rugulosus]